MQGILLIFGIISLLGEFTSGTPIVKYKDSKISHIIPAPTELPKYSSISEKINTGNDINELDKPKLNNSLDKQKITNHEILRSLGLTKLTIPPSHHRKRLAIESRHHARPDDSHMFIIKLPPNPVYYTNTRSASSGHNQNSIVDTNKKVSVDFKSNGKPGRIYHWNLPVLKKMFNVNDGGSKTNGGTRLSNDIDLIDIKHIPTWSKPWENDTIEKSFRNHHHNYNHHRHHSNDVNYKSHSPSYYAPSRPKKSSSHHSNNSNNSNSNNGNVHKYFPGNGKPKSFYIMDKKKNAKPQYQQLLP